MILNFGATTRYAGLTAGRFLRTLLPIASATAAMFGVVWAFGHFTSFAPLPTFLLKVAVGVVCYAGFGALFRLEAMRVAWELVKSSSGKGRAFYIRFNRFRSMRNHVEFVRVSPGTGNGEDYYA